ncbi:MAG: hypothetical protein E6I76_03840 [Chloroflexi bacterium]|nr:MAG: hypothetical protein E6I76_03840 [Chloroflexota bacterium]
MRLVATPPLAVIDIGSNSGRVAVLALTDDGHLEMLSDARTSLHLIDDVAASGRLSGEAIERVVRSVHDFLCIAATAHAERTVAVATAAVREASNGDELAERLLVETGITLEIIEGADEAHYALVGAVHGLAVEDGMLVDIGGGSLEISRFRGREAVSTWSLPLGAGRLTRGFLTSDPPRPAELRWPRWGCRCSSPSSSSSAPVAPSATSPRSSAPRSAIRSRACTDTCSTATLCAASSTCSSPSRSPAATPSPASAATAPTPSPAAGSRCSRSWTGSRRAA